MFPRFFLFQLTTSSREGFYLCQLSNHFRVLFAEATAQHQLSRVGKVGADKQDGGGPWGLPPTPTNLELVKLYKKLQTNAYERTFDKTPSQYCSSLGRS